MKAKEFTSGSSLTKHITGGRGQGRGVSRGFVAVLLFLLLAGLAPGAAAQTLVPEDWPLIPSGLGAGDQFRLLFITSTTRDATSTDIAVYNSFVQARAAAGHSAIREFSSQFRAFGSTATVDARDNTMTTGTGVPIYWLGGNKLADNYADFYDGSWDDYGRKDESGSAASNTQFWTGSSEDGTEHSFALGDPGAVVVGEIGTSSINLAQEGAVTSGNRGLLALSPVFKVFDGTICNTNLALPETVAGRPIDFLEIASFEFTQLHFHTAGLSEVEVTVRRTGTRAASVDYSTGDHVLRAATGGDITTGGYIPVSGTLRWAEGDTSEKSFTVEVANSQGSFRVFLSNVTNGAMACHQDKKPLGSRVHVKPKKPGAPVIAAERQFYDVGEGDGTVTVWVRKFGAGRATVDYLTSQGGAVPPGDYTHVSGTLTFPAGEELSRLPITIPILDDTVQESRENFVVSLQNPTGQVLPFSNPGGTATITPALSSPLIWINDNDEPSFQFRLNTFVGGEGSSASIDVTKTGSGAGSVDYATVDGTATAPGDYTHTTGTLTFASGDTQKTFMVPVIADGEAESFEEFSVTLSNPVGGILGSPNSAAVQIFANASQGIATPTTVTISADATEVTEGGDVTFTLTSTPAPQADLTVSVSADQEMGGEHGVASSELATVTVKAGETSATWTVTAMSDSVERADGTMTGSIVAGDGYTLGTPHEVTLTLVDDDGTPGDKQDGETQEDTLPTPVVRISGGNAVTEGGDATFTLTANPKPHSDITVKVTVTESGSFAVSGQTGRKTVTIGVGGTGSLTVATENDDKDEPDGAVKAVLKAGDGYSVRSPGFDSVTVRDNDQPQTDQEQSTSGGSLSGSDDAEDDPSPDREALLEIYKAAGGESWTRGDNWDSDAPVGTWYGVSADSDGRVTELFLDGNGLSGTIHQDIGKLEKLEVLYMNDNALSGAIPAEQLQSLGSLEELALWGNPELAGTIPDELGKRVDRAALRSIKEANGGSALSGWFAADERVFDYSGWEGVSVNDQGRVSELDFSGAGLSGDIADAVWALSGLERLDLSGNPDLTGELPPGIADTALEYVDISGSGVCASEEFMRRVEDSDIVFEDNENCVRGESPSVSSTETGEPGTSGEESGGGGCSVASGGGPAQAALKFAPALFAALIVLLSLYCSRGRRRRPQSPRA